MSTTLKKAIKSLTFVETDVVLSVAIVGLLVVFFLCLLDCADVFFFSMREHLSREVFYFFKLHWVVVLLVRLLH